MNCLETARSSSHDCQFYFAGSSEQFENVGGLLHENSASYKFFGLDSELNLVIDDAERRPNNIKDLRGDYSHAQSVFGWQPRAVLDDIVNRMCAWDMQLCGIPS